MSDNYSRKQNTNGYHIRIKRRINLGEDLLRKVRAVSNGIDDLVERDGRVAGWLTENRHEVQRIYTDESIAGGLPTATGIDLQDSSYQDILEELERIVLGRIRGLQELIKKTRDWDGLAPA